jgi:phosphatidylglycerol:prolipoprotein diacylglycerol transferase
VRPLLIDLGTVDLPLLGPTHLFLPTYGVLFALGVTLAWIWFGRRARTLGLGDEKVFNLTFYSLLGGIIGAKILLVLIDWRDYVADPSLLLGTIRTAGVLVGGVAGGAIVFVVYARRHDLPLIRLADAIVAPLLLAQALGRFGCLSAGCCYGVPVDAGHPLAVTFQHPQAIAAGRFSGTPLLAVQLIEALVDLALVVVLTLLWRRRPQPEGTVMWCYILLYSAARLTIEFYRGDVGRGLFFSDMLSTSQLFAIGGLLLSAIMLIRGRLSSGGASPS